MRRARVVVLTGSGKAFSSGGDLGMIARDTGAATAGEAPTMAGSPRDFYARYLAIRICPFRRSPPSTATPSAPGCASPWRAICASPSPTPKMGMTFTRLGIHPGMGATYFLPRLVGTSRACELFFTGRVFDAAEAERLGIVKRVLARADFDAAVRTLAREVAAAAPIAVRMVKKAIYRGVEHTLDEMLDYESLQPRALLHDRRRSRRRTRRDGEARAEVRRKVGAGLVPALQGLV